VLLPGLARKRLALQRGAVRLRARVSVGAFWRRSSATLLLLALTLALQGVTIVATELPVGRKNDASEQRVEADEAEPGWSFAA
jgi:hypothetical protein